MKKNIIFFLVFLLAVFMVFWGADRGFAHCDGMDGPVVSAAREALETGNVNLVLIWVQKKDEPEIKKAFQKTLAVRKLNPEAKEIAEMYFFETLVRIHRAGEGAPYTGLKPAGRDLGPAIPAADKSVLSGRLEPVYKILTEKIHQGLHEKFRAVTDRKNFDKDNVDAGRKYVEAYVTYIHYVEGLYDLAGKAAHGHFPELEGEGEHKH